MGDEAMLNTASVVCVVLCLLQMDDGHLAEALAPHVVHWLCQQKLTEPLEVGEASHRHDRR